MSDFMLGEEGLELPLELPSLISKNLSGGPIAAEHSLQKRQSAFLEDFEGRGMSSTHFVRITLVCVPN